MAAKKTPSTRRAADPLRALTVRQRAKVLDQLVRGDARIRVRAEQIADEILGSVDVDEVADDAFGALDIDSDEIHAGPTRDGYIDPTEAAWECLQDAVEPFLDDLKERVRQGRTAESARICQGIILGLYRRHVSLVGTEKVLGMAEDFPSQAADDALEAYLGKKAQKGAKVERPPPFPEEFWTRVPKWSGMQKEWKSR